MNLGGTVHLNRMGICVLFICFFLIAVYMIRDVEDSGPTKIATVNAKRLLFAAVELAEKGGEQVVNVRKNVDLVVQSKGKTKEGANNPVTEADYNSHCVMYFGLRKTFPTIKIISEEQILEEKCGSLASPMLTAQPADLNSYSVVDEELPVQDLTVWIDPLDATQEFTENLLQYVTTLVCVAHKGRPIIGVIHRPFGDKAKTTWAWVNRGLSSDLKEYKNKENGNPAVIVSRSHTGPIEKIIHDSLGKDTHIVKAGGAGYKVMQVVSGNASAYVHSTAIKKWDICAGNAVLSAMGGTMSTLTNEEIDYSSTAGALNRDGLLATMNDHQLLATRFHQALQRDMHL